MSLIRPELGPLFHRFGEAAAAVAVLAAGALVGLAGGWLLGTIGLVVVAAGAGWLMIALRHARFVRDVSAPGIVEVDEAQIGFLGPSFGGYVALPELAEVRLVTLHGRRLWRLKQADGQVLLVPVDASGADRLFDAFASLPGMDTAALVAALGPVSGGRGGTALVGGGDDRIVWRRPGLRAIR